MTTSDIKVEEDSDVPEEEDPLAVTSPATKGEQEVSYMQQASCSMTLVGSGWYQKYPVRISGWMWAVSMEVIANFLSALQTVLWVHLCRTTAFIATTSIASVTNNLTVLTVYRLWDYQLCT
jgi:hypothetical protein